LSIKADVLVTNENKKYIIYSQNLSQQFANSLKQAGNELTSLTINDEPKNIMKKILHGLNISFTSGNLLFPGWRKIRRLML